MCLDWSWMVVNDFCHSDFKSEISHSTGQKIPQLQKDTLPLAVTETSTTSLFNRFLNIMWYYLFRKRVAI